MLRDLYTKAINMRNGDYYWGEVVHEHDNYYNVVGTGIHVKPDNSFFMAENHVNGLSDGHVLYRGKNTNEKSVIGCFRNGKLYGPHMSFIYEKYLAYAWYNSNGQMDGCCCYVWHDGSYVVTRYDNGVCCGKGLYYEGGYMSFVRIDASGKIQSYLSKFHAGSDLFYTTCRMFMMPFDKNRNIESVGVANRRDHVSKIQVIAGEENGYGICRWDQGDRYFGEYMAGYRSGIGCYKYASGQTLLGKFYDDNLYGSATVWFADGGLAYGNFTAGRRDGVFFDIGAGSSVVKIANYEGNRQIGIAYYLDLNTFTVTMYTGGSDSRKIGTQYYG